MFRSAARHLALAFLVLIAMSPAVWSGDKDTGKKSQARGLDAKGHITLTSHKLTMEKGVPYVIDVQAKSFPPRVMIPGEFLHSIPDFSKPTIFKATFTPAQTKEYTFLVIPDAFGTIELPGPFDYTFKVTPVILADKPLLQVKAKWTDQDMKLPDKNTHFKSYPLKVKAGQIFIIDLERVDPTSKIDPFLYLKDGNQTVAHDDDSGGNLNARIVYTASKDAELTIVATTLFPITGDFVLTVRGPAEGKGKSDEK
jgi:hypothetical protein